jgi:hypothetical protein
MRCLRLILQTALLGILVVPTPADPSPCLPLRDRVRTLLAILDADWLTIRPERVRAAWFRPLDAVPTACHSEWGCLYLGNATVMPGSGRAPSIGDCGESFIFNPAVKNGPPLLTSVSVDEEFATVAEAQRAAELLVGSMRPPDGACPFLLLPWGERERGRECAWVAEGDWVIVLSIRLVHRSHTWETDYHVSREQF